VFKKSWLKKFVMLTIGFSVLTGSKVVEKAVVLWANAASARMRKVMYSAVSARAVEQDDVLATARPQQLRIAKTVMPDVQPDFNQTFEAVGQQLKELYNVLHPAPEPVVVANPWEGCSEERVVEITAALQANAGVVADLNAKLSHCIRRKASVTALKIARTTLPEASLDFNQTFVHMRRELKAIDKANLAEALAGAATAAVADLLQEVAVMPAPEAEAASTLVEEQLAYVEKQTSPDSALIVSASLVNKVLPAKAAGAIRSVEEISLDGLPDRQKACADPAEERPGYCEELFFAAKLFDQDIREQPETSAERNSSRIGVPLTGKGLTSEVVERIGSFLPKEYLHYHQIKAYIQGRLKKQSSLQRQPVKEVIAYQGLASLDVPEGAAVDGRYEQAPEVCWQSTA
jgi:hypothetical protein